MGMFADIGGRQASMLYDRNITLKATRRIKPDQQVLEEIRKFELGEIVKSLLNLKDALCSSCLKSSRVYWFPSLSRRGLIYLCWPCYSASKFSKFYSCANCRYLQVEKLDSLSFTCSLFGFFIEAPYQQVCRSWNQIIV